jgi:hypothetical protein
MPYKYTLIKELFYSTRDEGVPNSNVVNTLTNPETINTNSSRSLRTSFASGFKKLDGKLYNISYNAVRVPDNNPISDVPASFKETFVINDGPENSVTGTSVYNDIGGSVITTISKTKWTASGTGRLLDVNFAVIDYDNDGTRFGYPNSRRVRLFKLDFISLPQLAGNWKYSGEILKRSSLNDVPNFNTIFKTSSLVEITQKERFLILKIPKNDVRPTTSYLLGTLTYVANHWKLSFSDDDDNGFINLTQVNPREWNGNYSESGFCGSTTQNQAASIVSLKKV